MMHSYDDLQIFTKLLLDLILTDFFFIQAESDDEAEDVTPKVRSAIISIEIVFF